jgi:hypothetical protein
VRRPGAPLIAQAGLVAPNCAGTGDEASSTVPADSGSLHLTGDRGMKGRCPVHREDMAGRRLWHACGYGGCRRRVRWPQLSCGPRAGPNVPVTSEPWTPRVSWVADAPERGWCVLVARQRGLSSGLCWSACCADGVRGCPCDPAAGSPRVRTYGGQRRCGKPHPVVFTQVRRHMKVQAGAVCKTVGSAYVGSNPTPATTCENDPLAGNSRAMRAVSSLSRHVSPCSAVGPCGAASTDI